MLGAFRKLIDITGAFRLKEKRVENVIDSAADYTDIRTWEIVPVLTGHISKCREKNYLKENCKCKGLSLCDEYDDVCLDLREFLRRADLQQWCSQPRYRVDVSAHPHIMIRCSRYIADQFLNFNERVKEVKLVTDHNNEWR